MARLPKVVTLPDGSADLRLIIKPHLWLLLTAVGSEIEAMAGGFANGLNPGVMGARLLLSRLEDLVKLGDVRALPGPEWSVGLRVIHGLAKERDPDALPIGFDRTLLHLDSKRKAGGYTGVFTYGARFKARARHESGLGEVELGSSFKTAEMAALARFYYYLQRESLAYGEAEDEVLALRRIDPSVASLTDIEIWPQVVDHVQNAGRYETSFGLGKAYLFPGPREPQIAARAANKPVIDSSPIAQTRRLVLNQMDKPATSDEGLNADDPAQAPTPLPTWSGLSTSSQQDAPKRGRPRVHVQNGADSCACGNRWPCARVRYMKTG